MNDYYKLLEVDPRASFEVIDKAFKALSIKYHPDTNKSMDAAQAGQKWMDIREAYSVLSDPRKRERYDTLRKKVVFDVFMEEGIIGLVRRYLL